MSGGAVLCRTNSFCVRVGLRPATPSTDALACIDRGRCKDRTNLIADDTEFHLLTPIKQTQDISRSLFKVCEMCEMKERNTTDVCVISVLHVSSEQMR